MVLKLKRKKKTEDEVPQVRAIEEVVEVEPVAVMPVAPAPQPMIDESIPQLPQPPVEPLPALAAPTQMSEQIMVVKELPTRVVRSFIEDGVKYNLMTIEECLSDLMNSED